VTVNWKKGAKVHGRVGVEGNAARRDVLWPRAVVCVFLFLFHHSERLNVATRHIILSSAVKGSHTPS